MSCLTPARRASLERQRDILIAQITSLQEDYIAITGSTGSEGMQSGKFDSGEGSQSFTMRDPGEILETIQQAEANLARIENKLAGRGLVSVNMRRHP
ncbi:hypothetical protein KAR91_19615 [Candidatus Pacearchaeota archaeon]|nr:hypothetical protein [Candidatus Pacearchaeota archaeon]